MMKRQLKRSFSLLCLVLFGHLTHAQNATNKEILWTSDWSPNGKYIAVGGNVEALNIYTPKHLQLYKSYPIKNTITCVKWHPTQNILAVGTQGSSNRVSLVNFENDKIIELEGISPDGARGIDWNYSGEYLAVGDNDGQISIFDVKGNLIRKIKHKNTKSITSIDWHPKENIFITVGDKIRIFNLNGDLLKAFAHRKEETLLLSVAWHNSGDFFVTGDYGDHENHHSPLLQFWNTNGDLLNSISASKGEYRSLRWNPKGDKLASASDALRIWDKTGQLLYEGQSEAYLWGLSWNKQGNRLVSSSIEQVITIWDNKAKRIQVKAE